MKGKSETAGLLMAIDVGNTHTVIGIFDGDRIVKHWRVVTEPERTSDEYGMLMWSLFHAADMKVPELSGIAVSCVVPPMLTVVEELCQSYFHVAPIVVGP